MDDDLPSAATKFPPMSHEYAEVGQNVKCVQLCTAMPNHSGFAVTAHLELIILLTADPTRGPRSELKPLLMNIIVVFMCKVTNSSPF